MADEQKPISLDGEGYNVLTQAVLALMLEYSELVGVDIYFEQLSEKSGVAFSADNGALVMAERKSVTGKIWQTCQYPFFVVYRTESTQERIKLQIQTFLDTLGRWLCKEPAFVNGEWIRLKRYPELSEGRKIVRVTRSNSYGLEPSANGVQDWLLPVTVEYTNEIQPI